MISPNALNSEYCRRELEYVASLGKNIIFIHDEPVKSDEKKPLNIAGITPHLQLSFTGDARQLNPLLEHLTDNIKQIKPHTQWISLAHTWQDNNNDSDLLLYGRARTDADNWLKKITKKPPTTVFTVPEHVKHYINLSKQQPCSKRCLYHLNKLVAPVVTHDRFDDFVGSTAVVNPLALLPQLYVLFLASSSEAISVFMWTLFLFLQLSSALFAIKHRNFGLCMSMFASMLISASIIVIALLKR